MRPQQPSAWPFLGRMRLFVLLCSLFVADAAAIYPESPDTRICSQSLGRPLRHWACIAAINNLPTGNLPSIFTTRAQSAANNYIQVPVRYGGARPMPSCIITIDLDGHSLTDQFVSVPWDEIRKMAQVVVEHCVDIFNVGGFITYGVGRTFESLVFPTAYGPDSDIPTPAVVRQPDGASSYVAIPFTPVINEYSKSDKTPHPCPSSTLWTLSPSSRLQPIDVLSDVPYYMTITVSGPLHMPDPEATDYAISYALRGA